LIHVPGGDIRITAGASNRASIQGLANQTIDGDPNIFLTGGSGGSGSIATNTMNNAFINANRTQEIHAAEIWLQGGAGRDAVAGIGGGTQVIRASGDVHATGGTGPGTPVARIGSIPGLPTQLTLSARSVILTGVGSGGEASLGSAGGTNARPSTIDVSASGDVILNAGTAPARIGTPLTVAPLAGDVSISAGNTIQLNGGASPAAIRSADGVKLTAAGIQETGNGWIQASLLDSASSGATTLMGANKVAVFSGTSNGDLALVNTSPLLTLPAVQTHGGSFVLRQSGDAQFVGNASVGAMDVNATGSVYVRGGQTATEVAAGGLMNVVTGGDLAIAGGTGTGAFAALKGYSDVNLTIGGDLRINAGTGSGAYARLQTVNRDSAINIAFPNSSSGGWFVNDIDGALRRGLTGILSGEGVAVPEHTLFITYGQ
jgi:hypothetical protein